MYRDNYHNAISRITHGHMNPSVMNTFDLNHMAATFTLTNAIPQYEESNKAWGYYEDQLMRYAKYSCGPRPRGGTLFVVVGSSVILGQVQGLMTSVPPRRGDVRVAIPNYVWMAACCVWTDPAKVTRAESLAATILNHNNAHQLHPRVMPLQALEHQLTGYRKPIVNLFPGEEKCRTTSTTHWAK